MKKLDGRFPGLAGDNPAPSRRRDLHSTSSPGTRALAATRRRRSTVDHATCDSVVPPCRASRSGSNSCIAVLLSCCYCIHTSCSCWLLRAVSTAAVYGAVLSAVRFSSQLHSSVYQYRYVTTPRWTRTIHVQVSAQQPSQQHQLVAGVRAHSSRVETLSAGATPASQNFRTRPVIARHPPTDSPVGQMLLRRRSSEA